MSKKVKIIIAVVGGCIVGGLNVCMVIWPAYAIIIGSASALVAMTIATVTGIIITRES